MRARIDGEERFVSFNGDNAHLACGVYRSRLGMWRQEFSLCTNNTRFPAPLPECSCGVLGSKSVLSDKDTAQMWNEKALAESAYVKLSHDLHDSAI
jgi:hypothetical protein